MPLQQFRCPRCESETEVLLVERDEGRCCCGRVMRKIPQIFHHDAWGGPRYIRSLDRTFESHADLKRHLRENHLEQAPSADKYHGAREEGHRIRGDVYSFGRKAGA